MKFYLMCKKVLGEKPFEEFVAFITDQIVEKFSSSIFLDEYMQVLEYNIRVIMILSISNVLNLDEEEKSKRIFLEEKERYFVSDTLNEFEEKNQIYINKITDLLKWKILDEKYFKMLDNKFNQIYNKLNGLKGAL